MAIFIQINRVADTPVDAVYEFGPVDRIVGTVLLNKNDGQIALLDIIPESSSRVDFYFSRVRRVLSRHHSAGECPARTDYRA